MTINIMNMVAQYFDIGAITRYTTGTCFARVGVLVDREVGPGTNPGARARAAVEGLLLGAFDDRRYRTDEESGPVLFSAKRLRASSKRTASSRVLDVWGASPECKYDMPTSPVVVYTFYSERLHAVFGDEAKPIAGELKMTFRRNLSFGDGWLFPPNLLDPLKKGLDDTGVAYNVLNGPGTNSGHVDISGGVDYSDSDSSGDDADIIRAEVKPAEDLDDKNDGKAIPKIRHIGRGPGCYPPLLPIMADR